MTEKTLEALTDEEWDRSSENREDDGFRLLIGANMVLGDRAKKRENANLERGTAVDFNQACNITETIP
jgi:hypothetical protein